MAQDNTVTKETCNAYRDTVSEKIDALGDRFGGLESSLNAINAKLFVGNGDGSFATQVALNTRSRKRIEAEEENLRKARKTVLGAVVVAIVSAMANGAFAIWTAVIHAAARGG